MGKIVKRCNGLGNTIKYYFNVFRGYQNYCEIPINKYNTVIVRYLFFNLIMNCVRIPITRVLVTLVHDV